MARDEKKSEYRRIARECSTKAQSTIEYALILPLLFLMILGIMELAFMWHSNNALQFAAQGVVENAAISDCTQNALQNIVAKETAILYGRRYSFSVSKSNNIYTFTSNQKSKGQALITAKIACNGDFSNPNNDKLATAQLQSLHFLHFFSASLPNFATGERIEIIPSTVKLTSTKASAMRKF